MVTIKEINLKKEQVERIFTMIEKILKQNPNSQIYIEKPLFFEIKNNGKAHNIYHHKYVGTYHYRENEEYICALQENGGNLREIVRLGFTFNSSDFVQVTECKSKVIKNYVHYCTGMNQIVIFYAE